MELNHFFQILHSMKFLKITSSHHPWTNKILGAVGRVKKLTLFKLKIWLSTWFVLSLHPQYTLDKFFLAEKDVYGKKMKQNSFWDPPKLGKYMSYNRLKDAPAYFRLCNDPPPIYRDCCWMICPLIEAFNMHMEEIFEPSWLTCLDESMVSFLNKHCPNWVRIKQKPHLFEHNTIDCCFLSIIFGWNLLRQRRLAKGRTACNIRVQRGHAKDCYPLHISD